MRELKFRRHTDYDNEFIYYDLENSSDDDYIKFITIKTPIEQYTGLKDKNGKEIYEGDIVKWSYRLYRKCEKQYDNLVVEWSSGENEYYPCSTESGFSLPESEDGYEVIGNIHENPELVKEEE